MSKASIGADIEVVQLLVNLIGVLAHAKRKCLLDSSVNIGSLVAEYICLELEGADDSRQIRQRMLAMMQAGQAAGATEQRRTRWCIRMSGMVHRSLTLVVLVLTLVAVPASGEVGYTDSVADRDLQWARAMGFSEMRNLFDSMCDKNFGWFDEDAVISPVNLDRCYTLLAWILEERMARIAGNCPRAK